MQTSLQSYKIQQDTKVHKIQQDGNIMLCEQRAVIAILGINRNSKSLRPFKFKLQRYTRMHILLHKYTLPNYIAKHRKLQHNSKTYNKK